GSDPRSTNPAVFRPGQQITVEWEETINHPGYFTIAFSPANDTGFADNILYRLEDTQNDLNVPHFYSADITLPEVECDTCTLQLVQYMTERDPPSLYYSCADIRLVAEDPDTPPAPVQNVVTANGNNETSLAWEYSGTADLQTIILRSTSPIVDEPQDGQVLYENNIVGGSQVVYAGSGSQFVSTNLTAGQTYYYALYAYNGAGFYSEAVTVQSTAEQVVNDNQPPAPVSAFDGIPGDGNVELSWTNPTEDFYKVIILWDSNPIVVDPIVGTRYQPGDYVGTSRVVFNGLGSRATITEMINGETYYFRIYAHDGSFNYSTGTDSSVFLPSDGVNQKPVVSLAMSQNSVPVTTVYPDKGDVTIRAIIEDDSDISQATIIWTGTDNRIVDLDTAADSLTFDPSQLPEGRYTIRVTVSDNGNPPQTTSMEMSLSLSSANGDESGAGGMGHLGLILLLLVLQRYYAMRTRRV
ncbi:MAG: lytic polysaccharide monooxygenase, partial [Gammaproteobacteria bacterium]